MAPYAKLANETRRAQARDRGLQQGDHITLKLKAARTGARASAGPSPGGPMGSAGFGQLIASRAVPPRPSQRRSLKQRWREAICSLEVPLAGCRRFAPASSSKDAIAAIPSNGLQRRCDM